MPRKNSTSACMRAVHAVMAGVGREDALVIDAATFDLDGGDSPEIVKAVLDARIVECDRSPLSGDAIRKLRECLSRFG